MQERIRSVRDFIQEHPIRTAAGVAALPLSLSIAMLLSQGRGSPDATPIPISTVPAATVTAEAVSYDNLVQEIIMSRHITPEIREAEQKHWREQATLWDNPTKVVPSLAIPNLHTPEDVAKTRIGIFYSFLTGSNIEEVRTIAHTLAQKKIVINLTDKDLGPGQAKRLEVRPGGSYQVDFATLSIAMNPQPLSLRGFKQIVYQQILQIQYYEGKIPNFSTLLPDQKVVAMNQINSNPQEKLDMQAYVLKRLLQQNLLEDAYGAGAVIPTAASTKGETLDLESCNGDDACWGQKVIPR